ncbi:hypothetical protein M8C21_031383 [Ambrosia artemisiifolia]|uniref:Uncharacterized protein n=1 Tax=Ambrosia artemisiifolia TaxID=4212 RepID=A0AAD5GSP2_AMBAR|nr:hypothetical protein M8C21_031383 [Ambrosia artemisiifolia]
MNPSILVGKQRGKRLLGIQGSPWHGFDQACLCRCRPRDQKVVMCSAISGGSLCRSHGGFAYYYSKDQQFHSGGVTGTIADHIISTSFFYEDKTSLLQTVASTSNFICGFEDEGLFFYVY